MLARTVLHKKVLSKKITDDSAGKNSIAFNDVLQLGAPRPQTQVIHDILSWTNVTILIESAILIKKIRHIISI